jgi:hypothetical protein
MQYSRPLPQPEPLVRCQRITTEESGSAPLYRLGIRRELKRKPVPARVPTLRKLDCKLLNCNYLGSEPDV